MKRNKWTHKANIETGTGTRACRARITEEIDEKFVRIEFEHPTVRRMTAFRIISRDALTELL